MPMNKGGTAEQYFLPLRPFVRYVGQRDGRFLFYPNRIRIRFFAFEFRSRILQSESDRTAAVIGAVVPVHLNKKGQIQ